MTEQDSESPLDGNDLDDVDLQVINDVDAYGWHVLLIPEEGDLPAFAFSIGLFYTFQHPEILMIGQKIENMHQLINGIGESIRAGATFQDGGSYPDVVEGYDCVFVSVDPTHYDEYLGYAQWFYQSKDFPTLQCVWPDRHSHFPWDPEASDWVRQRQPVLNSV